jgi:hypothetical protein
MRSVSFAKGGSLSGAMAERRTVNRGPMASE